LSELGRRKTQVGKGASEKGGHRFPGGPRDMEKASRRTAPVAEGVEHQGKKGKNNLEKKSVQYGTHREKKEGNQEWEKVLPGDTTNFSPKGKELKVWEGNRTHPSTMRKTRDVGKS